MNAFPDNLNLTSFFAIKFEVLAASSKVIDNLKSFHLFYKKNKKNSRLG